jgi:hypothetical protein
MTSRASTTALAQALQQGFYGQEHAVSDHAIKQTASARVVPDTPIRPRR